MRLLSVKNPLVVEKKDESFRILFLKLATFSVIVYLFTQILTNIGRNKVTLCVRNLLLSEKKVGCLGKLPRDCYFFSGGWFWFIYNRRRLCSTFALSFEFVSIKSC